MHLLHAVKDCQKIKIKHAITLFCKCTFFKSPVNLKKSHWNSTLSAFVDIMIILLPRAALLFFSFSLSSLHLKGKYLAYIQWQKPELQELLTALLSLSAAWSMLWKETKTLFRCRCSASLIGCAAFLLYSWPLINQCWQGRGFVCPIAGQMSARERGTPEKRKRHTPPRASPAD